MNLSIQIVDYIDVDPDFCIKLYPGDWVGHDHEDHPIYVNHRRIQTDNDDFIVPILIKLTPFESVVKYVKFSSINLLPYSSIVSKSELYQICKEYCNE